MTSVRKGSGLGRWFGEKWVDLSRPKDIGGFEPCGRSDTSKGRYPKCVPAATAARMTPDEIRSAISRKRRAESRSDRDGKSPVMVPTFKDGRPSKRSTPVKRNRPLDERLYAKVRSEARRRFDVYPSAYANGWLVQEYKRRGGRYLRASSAPSSAALMCTSTTVFACKSKACAPPPVGSGGSNPSSKASDLEEYIHYSLRNEVGPPGSVERKYSSALATNYMLDRSDELYDFADPATARGNYISAMYSDVNDQLRGHDVSGESNRELVDELIEGMDKAFDLFGVPLRSRTVMYRGLDMEMGMDDARSLFAKGATITDDGFTSTSLEEHTAREFYGSQYTEWNNTQVLIKITALKGTTVLAGDSAENELILNRGTSFKVTSTKDEVDKYGDKTGRLLVNMQVLK